MGSYSRRYYEGSASVEIIYLLKNNGNKIKNYIIFAQENSFGSEIFLIEKAFQQNFQKFIFELSKTKL